MRLLARTVALLGAALLSFSVASSAQTTHQVLVDGITFTPDDLTIQEGDTVEWVWGTGLHDVVSGDFAGNPDGIWSSGAPTTGATFSLTFDSAFVSGNPVPNNEYTYYCSVHVGFGQTGIVRVAAPVPAFPAWAAVTTGVLVLAGAAFLLRGRVAPVGA